MTIDSLNQARDVIQRQLILNYALTSSPDTIFLLRRIGYDKKNPCVQRETSAGMVGVLADI